MFELKLSTEGHPLIPTAAGTLPPSKGDFLASFPYLELSLNTSVNLKL